MASSYRSPKVEIRKSGIHGQGLFAVQKINEGEIIGIKGGHIMNLSQLEDVVDDIEKSFTQIEHDFWIGAMSKSEVESNKLYINHSCDPNVGISGQITFVSIRDIEVGEELTYDLAMESDEGDKYWEFECNCQSPRCRGSISGDDWKRKDLQDRYGNHFSAYILNRIEKSRDR